MEGSGEFTDTECQVWSGTFRYKAAPGLRFKLSVWTSQPDAQASCDTQDILHKVSFRLNSSIIWAFRPWCVVWNKQCMSCLNFSIFSKQDKGASCNLVWCNYMIPTFSVDKTWEWLYDTFVIYFIHASKQIKEYHMIQFGRTCTNSLWIFISWTVQNYCDILVIIHIFKLVLLSW